MLQVRLSEEVWKEIAKRGKFGESEDDVLRRVFRLPPVGSENFSRVGVPRANHRRHNIATDRQSTYVLNGKLIVEYASGSRREFDLPSRDDKSTLRGVINEATSFAKKCGATHGQVLAIRKALTESGYHLTK